MSAKKLFHGMNINVTYLPKFDGQKSYLFVAIDRATRTLFFEIYNAKTSENAKDFIHPVE